VCHIYKNAIILVKTQVQQGAQIQYQNIIHSRFWGLEKVSGGIKSNIYFSFLKGRQSSFRIIFDQPVVNIQQVELLQQIDTIRREGGTRSLHLRGAGTENNCENFNRPHV
jgi:hypothetical protein